MLAREYTPKYTVSKGHVRKGYVTNGHETKAQLRSVTMYRTPSNITRG